MDEAEKELITGDLPELVDLTTECDPLLTFFISKKTLTYNEIQEIEAKSTPNKRTKEFYWIIQKKPGAFPVLLNAIWDCGKTGALSLLAGKPGIKLSLEEAKPLIEDRLAALKKLKKSGKDKIDSSTD